MLQHVLLFWIKLLIYYEVRVVFAHVGCVRVFIYLFSIPYIY
jgi:hypothetical protein